MALPVIYHGEPVDISLLTDAERRAKGLSCLATIRDVVGTHDGGMNVGMAQMREVIDYCHHRGLVIADTETAGLDYFIDRIVLLQVGDSERQYLIWWNTMSPAAKELFRTEVWCNPKIKKGGVNLKFDCNMLLAQEGLHWRGASLIDAQLIEQIICCGLTGDIGMTMKLTGMGAMAKRWLGLALVKDTETRTGWADMIPGQWDGDGSPEAVAAGIRKRYYAADDLCIPLQLLQRQAPWITEFDMMDTVKLEMEFLPELAEMETRGLLLDVERWNVLDAEAKEGLKKAVADLDALFDVTVTYRVDLAGDVEISRDKNYASGEQLKYLIGDWMREHYALDVIATNQQFRDSLQRNGYNIARLDKLFEKRQVDDFKKPGKHKQVGYPDKCDLIEGSDYVESLWPLLHKKLPEKAFPLPSLDSKVLKFMRILHETPDDQIDNLRTIVTKVGLPPCLVDPLVAMRETMTKRSRYGQNFIAMISSVSGRIHTDTTQCAADTARLTTSPNFQNLPKLQRYRDCIRARPGYKIVGSDAGQEEPRLIGEVSHCPTYMRVFWSAHPGTPGFEYWCSEQYGPAVTEPLDLYGAVGAAMHLLPPDGEKKSIAKLPVHQKGRGKSKTVVLGLGYGSGEDKYHIGLCLDMGIYVSRAESDSYYHGYWAIASEVKKSLDHLSNLADPRRSKRKVFHPYVEQKVAYSQSFGGRKRFMDSQITNSYTVGRNHPIQSTGAEILKATVVHLMKKVRKLDMNAYLLLTSHDELVGEAEEQVAVQFGQMQEDAWHTVGKQYMKYVPLLAESYVEDCWTKD